MAKMTVAHYTDYYYPLLGGVQTHIDTIVNSMLNYNHVIITNEIPGCEIQANILKNSNIIYFPPIDRRYCPKYNLPLHRLLFPWRLIADFRRNRTKAKYLNNGDYDLLHVHGPAINMNYLGVDTRLRSCFLTKQSYFPRINKPKILTLHGLFSPYSSNPVAKEYEEYLINQFDTIICVDKSIHSFIMRYLDVYEKTKNVLFIPNSIDTHKFQLGESSNPAGPLQVGYVGRLESPHGIELLMKLIDKIPDWIDLHIVAAGDECAIDALRSRIHSSNIYLNSNVKYSDMPLFYRKVDVLFNPVLFEAITRVSLEAMASGRPVIMADIGDRYPVIQNKTGYLVKNDIEDVFRTLWWIYNNKDKNVSIGKNARELIELEYSNRVIMQKISAAYEDTTRT